MIVGGGPAGLAIAREFFFHRTQVLVLESGRLEEDAGIGALNTVESIGEPKTDAQIKRRIAFHGVNAAHWSHTEQPYGVRCRVLGGSTQAWAGKSAAFDGIDFERRSWVPNSGWPISRSDVEPHVDRAAAQLNLGPNVYDDGLWTLIGTRPPEPQLDPAMLRTFFWQFARSRIDPMDLIRVGREFVRERAPNVSVLLNATATRILTNTTGTVFEGVEVACLEGVRARVRARVAVLAASGIENPRLLLASNQVHRAGIGNDRDVVGRYLLDHPGVRIGRFGARDASKITRRFGFYGVPHRGRAHMYAHGVALPFQVQEREGLLNCALYMIEERAPDDPLEAMKRLMRGRSVAPVSDLAALMKSPGLLMKALGTKVLQGNHVPAWLMASVVNSMIRVNPNFVVREHLNRGMPHKLLGLALEGISEQCPNPDSRITLSEAKDPLDVPLAKVSWKPGNQPLQSLARLGHLASREFSRVGLPAPTLEDWVAEEKLEDAIPIDMAHTMGTTRMSNDPRKGVVDGNCRVHDVKGLYIAGGSVFPTSGHANPTLMIVAMAIRLADHLKSNFPDGLRS